MSPQGLMQAVHNGFQGRNTLELILSGNPVLPLSYTPRSEKCRKVKSERAGKPMLLKYKPKEELLKIIRDFSKISRSNISLQQ